MKKSVFLTAMTVMAMASTGCNEEPAPMIWEFADYDRTEVTAEYAPDFVYQVAVTAPADYSGSITLRCTNYSDLSLAFSSTEADAGFTATVSDGNMVKLTFSPVENVGENGALSLVFISGSNAKESNSTNMAVSRVNKAK